MAAVKVTVNLPEESVKALRDMAARDGVSLTETLRRSIGLQKFIEDQQTEGSAILVKDKEDNVQRLVIR